ncbi:histidine phosphatase family protein [Polaromonas sp. CG_9.11]|uniref:histidine phosphatase family protein n=1 Tax=Polaromonas sp. CG_9.11 TaxID=2787730 RepID=UPI0018CB47AD|nr:histidine phosphatase family protein [Polaromonas sp. CG_9.11]MBG6077312.1 broad specificity phosphatase PhoE [Polaromonas sp. CG_9.11]
MGTLYLVRHGQASFGADDYDVLSPLGHQQSLRLGEYFKDKGVRFDAALTGTLNRQVQTFAGICEGMGLAFETSHASSAGTDSAAGVAPGMKAAPLAHLFWPGLNEFDSAAVIAAIHPFPLDKPDTPELYKHHFRLLKDGLAQWMAGVVSPRGMPSYHEFVAGITGALDHVRSHHQGHVLLVSSGGPIATAVGQVLGTSPETTIELNLGIRNCSVTEFSFTPKRHRLVTFNTLPHLDAPEHADWVTFA